MSYNEVLLHVHPATGCKQNCVNGPHVHCYREECQKILYSGEKVAKFRNGSRAVITSKGLPKYFCLDCGKLLSDSTVRN